MREFANSWFLLIENFSLIKFLSAGLTLRLLIAFRLTLRLNSLIFCVSRYGGSGFIVFNCNTCKS